MSQNTVFMPCASCEIFLEIAGRHGGGASAELIAKGIATIANISTSSIISASPFDADYSIICNRLEGGRRV